MSFDSIIVKNVQQEDFGDDILHGVMLCTLFTSSMQLGSAKKIMHLSLTLLSNLADEAPPVERCLFNGLAPAACLAAVAVAEAEEAAASGNAVVVDGAGWTGSGRRRIPKMSPSPSIITYCTRSSANERALPGLCNCSSARFESRFRFTELPKKEFREFW